MLTAAGSGYSTWRDLAVTRWREDATCDDWGAYVFLRDVAQRRGLVGGATSRSEPSPTTTSVIFNEDRAEFSRRDGAIATTLEVLVSAEDDAEVRRVTISNLGDRVREIEVTSYAELVLAPPAADVAHPAFSKLFVETEHLPDLGADPARPAAALADGAARSGRRTWRSSTARRSASASSRPIARASSAAAAASARRAR